MNTPNVRTWSGVCFRALAVFVVMFVLACAFSWLVLSGNIVNQSIDRTVAFWVIAIGSFAAGLFVVCSAFAVLHHNSSRPPVSVLIGLPAITSLCVIVTGLSEVSFAKLGLLIFLAILTAAVTALLFLIFWHVVEAVSERNLFRDLYHWLFP